uniref:Ubiquinol oxidase n=1 Tax=Aegilops tauschii TaxID=37682 RepID=N1QUA5_AEGTA
MSSRMAGATLLRHLGPHLFAAAEPASGLAASARGGAHAKQEGDAEKPESATAPEQNKKPVASYWGIEPRKLVKDDGTEWPWFSFRPWDTYRPDTSIDVAKHHEPRAVADKPRRKLVKDDGTEWPWFSFRPWDTYRPDTSIDVAKHHEPRAVADKVAYLIVRTLRAGSDLFFQRRHASHALLLETVAAVPPMVGGVLLHLRSLRRFEHSGGWIRALMEEAENERMHLMTFMEGVFFNAYFVGYLISPKLKDVVIAVRADEAHHRDANHYASDIHYQGMTLNQTPAPLGYH